MKKREVLVAGAVCLLVMLTALLVFTSPVLRLAGKAVFDLTNFNADRFFQNNIFTVSINPKLGENSGYSAFSSELAKGRCGCTQAQNDIDGDCIPNIQDNCNATFNPAQADSDSDGLGDECDPFYFKAPLCGDSLLDQNERCDDGNRRNGDGCNENCTREFCGDGVVTLPEECDPVNLGVGVPQVSCAAGYSCKQDCTCEKCGDSIVQFAAGEKCDPPGAICASQLFPPASIACDGACQCPAGQNGNIIIPPTNDTTILCGNGVLDPGEDCERTSAGGQITSKDAPCYGLTQYTCVNCKCYKYAWANITNPQPGTTLTPSTDPLKFCGNGVADPGEQCNEPGLVCPTSQTLAYNCNRDTCECIATTPPYVATATTTATDGNVIPDYTFPPNTYGNDIFNFNTLTTDPSIIFSIISVSDKNIAECGIGLNRQLDCMSGNVAGAADVAVGAFKDSTLIASDIFKLTVSPFATSITTSTASTTTSQGTSTTTGTSTTSSSSTTSTSSSTTSSSTTGG